MQLRLIAVLCLGIAGCGAAHGSIKSAKKVKPPAKVEVKAEAPTQVEITASSSDPILTQIAKNLTRPVGDDPAPSPNPPQPTPPVILPTLEIPSSIDGEVGSFIKVTAVTNGEQVRWVSMDKGLAVFPGEMLKDSTSTVVMSAVNGTYRLLAYTALNDVPSDPVITMISVHGAQPPPTPQPTPQPVPVPIPAPPQPTPMPVPTPAVDNRVAPSNLYVVTIDDVTMRTPTVSKVLTDNEFWTGLSNQGVEFVKLNSTNANVQTQFGNQLKLNTNSTYPKGMPCVILLNKALFQQNADHSWLNTGATELQLPPTTDALHILISKYTK